MRKEMAHLFSPKCSGQFIGSISSIFTIPCHTGNSLTIRRSLNKPVRGQEIEAEHSVQSPESHRLLMPDIKTTSSFGM